MSPSELLSLGFSKELVVLIIAALPIAELRGALPVAINVFHLPWYYALALAITGNLFPVPFLLLFFDAFARLLNRLSISRRILHKLMEHAGRRSESVKRYERIGLALFVAIPLPITGAWTGSLIAVLLGFKFRYAFLSIAVGVLAAGAIVTSLSLLGWLGAIIAGAGLLCLTFYTLLKARKGKGIRQNITDREAQP